MLGFVRGVAAVFALVVAVTGAGAVSAAAAADSQVLLAFGLNTCDQLGVVTDSASNPTPRVVTLPGQVGRVTQVAAGNSHSLAVTASGQLYAFGCDSYGELGFPPPAPNTMCAWCPLPRPPPPTLVELPGQEGGVTQVAAGFDDSLVLTASGQLYAFGLNSNGQLGTATNMGANEPNWPTLVTLPGQVGPVTQIAAGGSHSLALTASGQLYAFGDNIVGQLGNATNNAPSQYEYSRSLNPTPTLVTLPGQNGDITQIAAGGSHSLVLTTSGQVYAFGDNSRGQLGTATNSGGFGAIPNPTPTLVALPGQDGRVTQIAAGGSHSLVLTASGQFYAFGDGTGGDLGRATSDYANPTPTLVELPGEVGEITQIVGKGSHSLAVTASGQLFGFGSDSEGQLADPDNVSTGPPPEGLGYPCCEVYIPPHLVASTPGTTIEMTATGATAGHTFAVLTDHLAIAATPLDSAQVGTPYQATLQASGRSDAMSWSAQDLPAGLAIDPASGAISGTPGQVGSFSPRITLSDDYGTTTSHVFTLRVDAHAPAFSTAAVGRSPRLTALTQPTGTWRLGKKLPRLTSGRRARARTTRLPVGTAFSFRLDQPARVTFTFHHPASGRLVSHACVAKTPRTVRSRHCTRTITDGTLRLHARAGANTLQFQGPISRHTRLKAGRYTVTITVTGAAGTPSAPRSLTFTIVK